MDVPIMLEREEFVSLMMQQGNSAVLRDVIIKRGVGEYVRNMALRGR
jgi:hypothetical protein